ncbi:unnamed protein product [Linum trigynum]|uniref:Uncharacterized protein n=1 Tax=Linum trigynum TaxID=586398 RepID=A0AAV2ERF2_9ROSI
MDLSEPNYRCGETGHRIPLKCMEIKDGVKLEKQEKSKKNRSDLETSAGSGNQQASSIAGKNLAEDSKKLDGGGGSQAYITYRSYCLLMKRRFQCLVLRYVNFLSGAIYRLQWHMWSLQEFED